MMRACQETLYPTRGETEKPTTEHLAYRQSHLETLQSCGIFYAIPNAQRFTVRGPGYRAGAADLLHHKGRTTEEHTPTPAHARLGFALAKLPFLLPTDFGSRHKNI